MFGTPFTYFDNVSKALRSKRMAYVEGFFGALSTRFGIIKGSNAYRHAVNAGIAVLEAFIPILALANMRRKMQDGRAGHSAHIGPLNGPRARAVPSRTAEGFAQERLSAQAEAALAA